MLDYKMEAEMNIRSIFFSTTMLFAFTVYALAQGAASGGVAAGRDVDVSKFLTTLDINKDGSLTMDEWKRMGLMDASFPLCDANKDEKITKAEMQACALPEDMDPQKEGILTIYTGGRFVIPTRGVTIAKPANLPPGITQLTQFVADSPYVEGGPTGEDFIKMFDADGDGKVSHMEWEKLKNNTVFKPFRWPQYNRNRDEWITVDEAPQPPTKK